MKTEGPDPLDEQVEQDERRLDANVESLDDPLFVSSQLMSKSLAKWNDRMSGENCLSLDSDCSIPLLHKVFMLEQVDLHSDRDDFRGTA
jgi:hypothetical protein